VGEVDKLMNKYAGREEQLFVNLAKKYNLDPKQFGVNTAAPPASSSGFGSTTSSQSTGAATFGSPAPMGNSSTFSGSSSNSTFGATSGGFANAPGFGSLASAPAAGGFSSFGQPQQQQSPFGGGFGAARR